MTIVDVLDRLKLDVVNVHDFTGDRPFDVAARVGAPVILYNPDEDPIVRSAGTALVDDTERHGYAFGLRFNASIDEDPIVFANRRSQVVQDFGGAARVQVVGFDVELAKDRSAAERLTWQAKMMDRWDAIRYARPTVYNVAALQDQTQNDYVRMLRRNRETGQRLRKIAVQPYFGAAMELANVRAVVDALVDVLVRTGAGTRVDVEPCVDPAHAVHYLGALDCETRGGWVFEAGRVPATA